MVALEVLDLPKTHDPRPMTRNAALRVLLPGARIAPARAAVGRGAIHALRTVARTDSVGVASWLVGFASSPFSVAETGDDRTLPLLPHPMDKVEL
jgi:hypothetical protein